MNEQGDGRAPSAAEPSMSTSKPALDHELPDPDEDDLDDLDELLDDFSSSKPPVDQQIGPPQPPLQHDSSSDVHSSAVADDEFDKQLQEQMAALMGNADESPEMQQEIQAMLQELSAAMDPGPAPNQSDPKENHSHPPAATDESFQEAIHKTMQRMQASGDKATAAAAADQDPNDILAQMLKEMPGGSAGGAAGDEDLSKMLMTMMEQLTNKDILYDPMKELNEKFPAWMRNNRDSVKADDLARYEKQQRLVAEIVGKFEESAYSDTNSKDREYIVERMQEMQAAGSPPEDLVGDMTGAQDALQDISGACPQQ